MINLQKMKAFVKILPACGLDAYDGAEEISSGACPRTHVVGAASAATLHHAFTHFFAEDLPQGIIGQAPAGRGPWARHRIQSVSRAKWISKDLGHEGLRRCIEEAVKGWRFPTPSDARPARVDYFAGVGSWKLVRAWNLWARLSPRPLMAPCSTSPQGSLRKP